MTVLRRPFLWLAWLAGTGSIAMIVHLVTVLQAPTHARHDAFARIGAATPLAALTVLPGAGSPESLRHGDAAMRTGLCRYDLRDGPLLIDIAPVDAGFLSLGFHTRRGITFYGFNLWSGSQQAMTLTLATAAQKAAADLTDAGAPTGDVRIVAPEPEGFLVVQTPLEGTDNLAGVRCRRASPAAGDGLPASAAPR